MAKIYACPGTCGGKVTEEQYNEGKKTCGMEGCTFHGKPLEPLEQCDSCIAKSSADGKLHVCEDCE